MNPNQPVELTSSASAGVEGNTLRNLPMGDGDAHADHSTLGDKGEFLDMSTIPSLRPPQVCSISNAVMPNSFNPSGPMAFTHAMYPGSFFSPQQGSSGMPMQAPPPHFSPYAGFSPSVPFNYIPHQFYQEVNRNQKSFDDFSGKTPEGEGHRDSAAAEVSTFPQKYFPYGPGGPFMYIGHGSMHGMMQPQMMTMPMMAPMPGRVPDPSSMKAASGGGGGVSNVGMNPFSGPQSVGPSREAGGSSVSNSTGTRENVADVHGNPLQFGAGMSQGGSMPSPFMLVPDTNVTTSGANPMMIGPSDTSFNSNYMVPMGTNSLDIGTLPIQKRVNKGRIEHFCPFIGCSYKTFKNTNLVGHIRQHTGEKPYKCSFPECKYSSSQLSNIKVHERLHYGIRPYKCDFPGCPYAANQNSNLKAHKRRTHGSLFPPTVSNPVVAAVQQVSESLSGHGDSAHASPKSHVSSSLSHHIDEVPPLESEGMECGVRVSVPNEMEERMSGEGGRDETFI